MSTDVIKDTGSTINPFVKGLFSGKAITTQAHPKSKDTIIVVQQSVKPMQALSTWCKGTMRWMPIEHDATTATITENDQDDQDASAQHGSDDAGASSTMGASGLGTLCVGKHAFRH